MDFLGQLSPKQTLALLTELGHNPNKQLGQNFLIDANIVRKSLDFANVEEGDNVVEVGPGLGTLTGALLGAKANVYAVELDRRLFEHLKKTFLEDSYPNLSLINADALDLPFGLLPEAEKNFKIVANLPYAISTPWMDLAVAKSPQRMALMLQKEAAMRFAANKADKDFCPISIFVNSAYDVCQLYKVSATCFYPKPNVDSALLSLKLKDNPFFFEPKAKVCIRKIFSQRRKQIGAIVKNIGDEYPQLGKWLESLDYKQRPESINMASWQLLNSVIQE